MPIQASVRAHFIHQIGTDVKGISMPTSVGVSEEHDLV